MQLSLEESDRNPTLLKALADELGLYSVKQDPDEVAKKIRQVISITIWAEKNSPETFNEFFDSKVVEKLLNIFLKSKQRQLLIVIIESISLMMTNFQKQEGILRLLFDPAMNSFLITKFNSMTTQVAEYYINLLKSLTTRIDQNILPLIYNKKLPSFALAWQASRFYNHPELLIRAASRTIILSLMKINNPQVKRYFSSFPFVIYYSHLLMFVKEYWFKINQLMEDKYMAEKEELMRLPQIVENHFDILLYVEDLLSSEDTQINDAIVNGVFKYLISDLVYSLKSPKKEQFSLSFVLYMFGVLFKVSKNELMVEMMTVVLFGYYSLIKINKIIEESRFSYIDSYNKRWNFKTMWDQFDSELEIYNQRVFEITAKNPDKNQGRSLTKIAIVSDTLYLFGYVTNPKFQEHVQKLGKVYGFDILLDKKVIKYDSLVEVYRCLNYKLFQAKIDPEEFDQNANKDILLQLLQSKDDNMIMLVLQIYLNLFSNPATSKKVLSFCRISIHQPSQQFYTRVTSEKLLTACFQILAIYPSLRLCTIFNAIRMILFLTRPYAVKSDIVNPYMKNILYKALKISVDTLQLKINNYKNLFTMVQLYEMVGEQLGIDTAREFGIGAYGLVGNNELTSLYEKVTFSDKEDMEKGIHYHFMLRRLVQYLSDIHPQYKYQKLGTQYKLKSPVSKNQKALVDCTLMLDNQAVECCLQLQPNCLVVIIEIQRQVQSVSGLVYQAQIYRKLNFNNEDPKRLIVSVVNCACNVLKTMAIQFQTSKRCAEVRQHLQQLKLSTTNQSLQLIRGDIALCLHKNELLQGIQKDITLIVST